MLLKLLTQCYLVGAIQKAVLLNCIVTAYITTRHTYICYFKSCVSKVHIAFFELSVA